MSAFIAWAELVGADVDTAAEARMKMRLPDFESHKVKLRQIREGFRLWVAPGRDPIRFREAKIAYSSGAKADAWQYL